MSCNRGCCETQADHYRSVSVAHPDRNAMRKVTTDDHGTHQVDVTEHYGDRQDVNVRVPPVVVRTATNPQKD